MKKFNFEARKEYFTAKKRKIVSVSVESEENVLTTEYTERCSELAELKTQRNTEWGGRAKNEEAKLCDFSIISLSNSLQRPLRQLFNSLR